MSTIWTSGPSIRAAGIELSSCEMRTTTPVPLDIQTRHALEERTRDVFECPLLQWRLHEIEGADIADDGPSVATFVAVYAPELLRLIEPIRYAPEVVYATSTVPGPLHATPL